MKPSRRSRRASGRIGWSRGQQLGAGPIAGPCQGLGRAVQQFARSAQDELITAQIRALTTAQTAALTDEQVQDAFRVVDGKKVIVGVNAYIPKK